MATPSAESFSSCWHGGGGGGSKAGRVAGASDDGRWIEGLSLLNQRRTGSGGERDGGGTPMERGISPIERGILPTERGRIAIVCRKPPEDIALQVRNR